MITLQKLKKAIDENFSEPFLEEGLVTTTLNKEDKSLNISIGPRDITIDENGNVTGSGTYLCCDEKPTQKKENEIYMGWTEIGRLESGEAILEQRDGKRRSVVIERDNSFLSEPTDREWKFIKCLKEK